MNERQAHALPTGFANLDRALGLGGFPRGRIVEIFGPTSSGKTALALQCAGNLQRRRETVVWIDAEHAFDPPFAAQLGVDLAAMPIAQPDSAEEAMEMARRLAASGAVDLIFIDSAAALAPELELQAGIDGGSLQSRVLGSELRKLALVATRTAACIVFLNQVRTHMEAAGEPETTAGGPSLKLHAAVRIALGAKGRLVRFRIVRNQLASAFATGELEWRPGMGFREHP